MTALAKDRKTDKMGPEDMVLPGILGFPIAASTKVYGGSLVATDSAGRVVPASATATLVVQGRAEKQVDNSSGNAGALTVEIRQGVFYWNQGTGVDAITIANRFQSCYASDDNTVNLTDAGGTRPFAGYIVDVRADGQVAVATGIVPSPSGAGVAPAAGNNVVYNVRGVATANVSNLASFTVANDGITLVEGDRVLLPAQTTASQNGIYVVGVVGGGTAPLTRAADFDAGTEVKSMSLVTVSAGTVGTGLIFKLTTAGAITVGTTSIAFTPILQKGTATLVAGTVTVNAFVLAGSSVVVTRNTANTTTATTGGYAVPTRTPGANGALGTFVIQAQVAAGTISNADVSTIDWVVTN
jgi:hypothetical protein